MGRRIGLCALALLLAFLPLSGCSDSAADDLTARDTATPEAGAAADSPSDSVYALVLKERSNPYMLNMYEGFARACEEMGVTPLMVGPDSYTAEEQIGLIYDLIELEVQVIAVAANHTDALQPALLEAMDRGIVVVSLDSSVNADSRMVHIQQADPEKLGRVLIQAAHSMVGGEGTAVVITSTPYATNQNLWIEWMRAEIAENPEKYADFALLDVLYGEDSAEVTAEVTRQLLEDLPELDVIITPSVVSMLAVGEVLAAEESAVLFTGLGQPSDIADFIRDGSCPWMYLWNPIEMGYLAAYAAHSLEVGEIVGEVGDRFTAGNLGLRVVVDAADGGTEILLGDPIKFDRENIEEWSAVY